jgi:hypothetical protein
LGGGMDPPATPFRPCLVAPNPAGNTARPMGTSNLGSNTDPREKLCWFKPLLIFVPGPNPLPSTTPVGEKIISSSLVGKIPSVALCWARGEPEPGGDPPLPSPCHRRPLPPSYRPSPVGGPSFLFLPATNPTDGGGGSSRGQVGGKKGRHDNVDTVFSSQVPIFFSDCLLIGEPASTSFSLPHTC